MHRTLKLGWALYTETVVLALAWTLEALGLQGPAHRLMSWKFGEDWHEQEVPGTERTYAER